MRRARRADCRCNYRFTCGACMANAPAWHFTPSTITEQSMDTNLTPQQQRDDLAKAFEIMRTLGTPEMQEQFRKPAPDHYQGHAGTQGGLQNHSIGDVYPWIVYGKGDPTLYGVMHATDGRDTGAIFDCARAIHWSEQFKAGNVPEAAYMAFAERTGRIVRIPAAAVAAGVANTQ